MWLLSHQELTAVSAAMRRRNEAGESAGAVGTIVRQPIALGLGQPLDQAVQSQTAQLVAHAPRADVVGALAEQDRESLTQLLVGETAWRRRRTSAAR